MRIMRNLLVTAAAGLFAMFGLLPQQELPKSNEVTPPAQMAANDPSDTPWVLVADPVECAANDEPLGVDPGDPLDAGESLLESPATDELKEIARQLREDAAAIAAAAEELKPKLKAGFPDEGNEQLDSIQDDVKKLLSIAEDYSAVFPLPEIEVDEIDIEAPAVEEPKAEPAPVKKKEEPTPDPIPVNPYAGCRVEMHTAPNAPCPWCDVFEQQDMPKLKALGIEAVKINDLTINDERPQIKIYRDGKLIRHYIGRITAEKVEEKLKR